jgi:hypothetical protein
MMKKITPNYEHSLSKDKQEKQVNLCASLSTTLTLVQSSPVQLCLLGRKAIFVNDLILEAVTFIVPEYTTNLKRVKEFVNYVNKYI